MHKSIFLLFGLMVILPSFSCVREKTEDCPPVIPETGETRVYVHHRDVEGWSRSSIDHTEIEILHLFVFDSQGKFVESHEHQSPDLSNDDFYFRLELDPGVYDFVTWANLQDCYYVSETQPIPGVTTKEQVILYINTDDDEKVLYRPHHLFFSDLCSSEIVENTDNYFRMKLIRDTYIINVSTEGLTPSDYEYATVITDRNGTYNFDNSIAHYRELHYIMPCEKDENYQLHTTLTVLRLMEEHRNAVLKLENTTTGNIIFEENLIELILQSRSLGAFVDFDNLHEYDVIIKFRNGAVVSVSINGWLVIEDEGEIHA